MPETPPPSYADVVSAQTGYPDQPPSVHTISDPQQFPLPTLQFPPSTVTGQPSAERPLDTVIHVPPALPRQLQRQQQQQHSRPV